MPAEQLSVGDVVLLPVNSGDRRVRLEVVRQRASSVKLGICRGGGAGLRRHEYPSALPSSTVRI
ncbi:hypothetical protein ABT369_55240 [Dactylosporangium sp. NPDC000244]|uniref:hypothetical protein n=1 Tax=Dactylosporangium sp. NPDC000244 TaxID=3154365 RepID=UPI0033295A8B